MNNTPNKQEELKAKIKCTGCGGIPTLCDKCNQEICADGQDNAVEQAISEFKEKLKKRIKENNFKFNGITFDFSSIEIGWLLEQIDKTAQEIKA